MASSKNCMLAANNTIAVLADLYPRCFWVFQDYRKPLKIGVHADIIAALNGAADAKEIGFALRVYTANIAYLRSCKQGAERIGLDGAATGYVSGDEAINAKQRLTQQFAKRKLRRAAAAEVQAKAKAEAEAKARNTGRVSLASLRAAAQARRAATA